MVLKMNGKILKKIIKIAFSLLLFISIPLFFSCTSAIDGTVQAKSGLSIIISNFNQIETARLISPGSFDINDVKKYKIDGEDLDGNKLSQSIEIVNGTGTLQEVTNSIWSFVLHAYSDTSGGNEVLCGYASVDTTHTSIVSFVLDSVGLEKNGSYDLTFTYSGFADFENVIKKFSIELQNTVTYSTVSGYTVSSVDPDEISEWVSGGYNVTGTIAPGYYYLVVRFYGFNELNQYIEIGTYSDILDIQPNRLSSDVVDISDVLYLKPDAPDNLKVYRLEKSLKEDSYTVLLQWDDLSVNEESFEIQAITYDANTTTQTKVSTINVENFTTFSLQEDGINWVGGSLCYGSGRGECQLRLQTGKIYDFKICAVNSSGKSDYQERKASVDTNINAYGDLKGFDVSAASPFQRINTFAVIYNLMGGTYRTAPGVTKTDRTLIEYYIWNGAATELFEPENIPDGTTSVSDIPAYPIIYFGNFEQKWLTWTTVRDNTSASIASLPSSIHSNIEVFAIYQGVASPVMTGLDETKINIKYGVSQETLNNNFENNSTLSIDNIKYLVITLERNSEPNSLFTSFNFFVNGTVQYTVDYPTESSISYTIPIPFKGTYTLQVNGYYSNAWYYSQEYTFKVN